MTDPMDLPEDDAMELVMPFVVCKTQGGPYDDEAFVAGFEAGKIDRTLAVAEVTDAAVVKFPIVHTALAKQLELIGMRYGFPVVQATSTDEWPEWCAVTFRRAEGDAS